MDQKIYIINLFLPSATTMGTVHLNDSDTLSGYILDGDHIILISLIDTFQLNFSNLAEYWFVE